MSTRSRIILLLSLAVWILPELSSSSAWAQRSNLDPISGSGGDTSAHVSSYPYIDKTDQIQLNDSALDALSGGTAYSVLPRASSLVDVFCATSPVLVSTEMTLRFDVGDDYQYGRYPVAAMANVTIKGFDGTSGLKFQRTLQFSLDEDNPEQVHRFRFNETEIAAIAYQNVATIRVYINSYSCTDSVRKSARLTVSYRDEWGINALHKVSPESPLFGPVALVGEITTNPVTFQWRHVGACNDVFSNYQFQLLRLYNTDTSAAYASETTVHTTVDWSRALTIETGDSNRYLTLTIAEGTGFYLWRVRPIGSRYPGGAGSNWNWGVWSESFEDGTDLSFEEIQVDTLQPDAFFYRQFEKDRIWTYQRGFSEGTRIAEGMTYLNTLGQGVQSQVQVRSADTMLVGQTLYDYNGRAALESLPVPVDTGAFRYVEGMLLRSGTLYDAPNFDAGTTYQNPESVNDGYVSDYYSNANSNPGVPSSDNYPFARALPARDGTGRIEEQGGPGAVYRIGGGAGGASRTSKVYYSSVSDEELIRIFGDEAPIDTNVVKVLGIDPNKVVTVQYTTIDGQVIATGIQADDSNPLLLGLDEGEHLDRTISDTIIGSRMRGRYAFNGNKRFAFATPTAIQIHYRLQPDTLHDGYCGLTHCATCDYRVRIFLHNIDNPDSSIVKSFVLGADPCDSAASIDTTFSVTVPAGTYIVEKRLETNTTDSATITPINPIGLTYAEIYRQTLAQDLEALIRSSDTVEAVMGFLSRARLDSLYLYLDVSPDAVTSRTIQTGCCEITIPIIPLDCAIDPCRDSIPDFEWHLARKWGDLFSPDNHFNLNNYFRHDGIGIYPPDPNGRFTLGKGAFNFMIGRMLQELDGDGHPVYDCKKLWACWDGLVQNFKTIATSDGGVTTTLNPDFDLMQTFLNCAGVRYQDTATVLYDTNRSPLLYAYKYINYAIGTNTACETSADYATTWHGEPDSSDNWRQLAACVDAGLRTESNLDDDDCSEPLHSDERDACFMRQWTRYKVACESACESHRGEFMSATIAAYENAGRPRPSWDTLQCIASSLIDSCMASCSLTIHDALPDDHEDIDSIGTYQEFQRMRDIQIKIPSVTLPNLSNECPDSTHRYEGWEKSYEQLILDDLNWRMLIARQNHNTQFQIDTSRYIPLLRNNFDVTEVLLPGHGFNGNPHFELRNGCELWYVTDTLFFSDSLHPHPLVSHLNEFLDRVWGFDIAYRSPSAYKDYSAISLEVDLLEDDTTQHYEYYSAIDTGHMVVSPLGWLRSDFEDTPFSDINGSRIQLPVLRYIRTSLDTFGILRDTSAPNSDPNTRFAAFRPYSTSPISYIFGFEDTTGVIVPLLRGQVQDTEDTLDYLSARIFVSDYHLDIHDNRVIDSLQFDLRWRGLAPDTVDSRRYWKTLNQEQVLAIAREFSPPSIGEFAEDAEHYLAYIPRGPLYQFPDTCRESIGEFGTPCYPVRAGGAGGVVTVPVKSYRIFNLRFSTDLTQKIADSLCEPWVCPDVCFSWVDRPIPVYDNVDTVRNQSCEETALIRISSAIETQIRECVDSKLTEAAAHYTAVCASPDSVDDLLHVDYPIDYMHFTLYYYDRAGNIVRTVPPAGVKILPDEDGDPPTRLSKSAHKYASRFEYNSLGQVITSYSPDGGSVGFWYDYLGRIRFTQNRQQQIDSVYSYVKYDNLGRPVETGESNQGWHGTDTSARTAANLNNPGYPTTGTERAYSVYTTPADLTYLDGRPQKNLRNRISYDSTEDGARTVYSYDNHGNIEWVGTLMPGFPVNNFVRYEYELISGNVVKVHYNEGRTDQLHHWYLYDEDNRLVEVRTSRDSVIWDSDARYYYSAHGSLDRIELGEDKLQGLDQTYTLQGALKAINHPSLNKTKDPGGDGTGGEHNLYPADSFSVALGYFKGDFNRSGNFDSTQSTSLNGVPLYDGNISSVTSHIGHKADSTGRPLKYEKLTGEVYRYDLLGRLDSSHMRVYNGSGWDTTSNYATRYEHDENGNLLFVGRRAYDTLGGLRMDSLTYVYNQKTLTPNRLHKVTDAVTGASSYDDIKNGQSDNNYQYDSTGSLKYDGSEGGMIVEWNSNGKVKQITTLRGTTYRKLSYNYDAGGSVVRSQLRQYQSGALAVDSVWNTWYSYDAGGTVMAIYQQFCPHLDSDNDGVIDSEDNCPSMANIGQDDADGDGVGNACDNCTSTYNPQQEDLDNDGMGDFCDTDLDGDGVPNSIDNCIYIANPGQGDSNGNGIGNLCEIMGGGSLDTDHDGIADSIDTCPYVSNTDQSDDDGDGFGNACDNCPGIPNHEQLDLNHNNIGDTCESYCGPVSVEFPVYGMDRIATIEAGQIVPGELLTDTILSRRLGQKFYELHDHLGNVRVVMSDIKLPLDTTGGRPFKADIRSYSNMYPYGMQQPYRSYSPGMYRYGYNGMEAEDRLKDTANHYTTYFRAYDPRLARFWGVDPVVKPGESPYAAISNNPIALADPSGASPDSTFKYKDERGKEITIGVDLLAEDDKTGIMYSKWNEETSEWDPQCTIWNGGTVWGKKNNMVEGQEIHRGLDGSDTYVWHILGTGNEADLMTEESYDALLGNMIEHQFDDGFSPSIYGFNPDFLQSQQFLERYNELGSRRWRGTFRPNNKDNPFFHGDGLESDPFGDALIAGAVGLTARLLVGSAESVLAKSFVRALPEVPVPNLAGMPEAAPILPTVGRHFNAISTRGWSQDLIQSTAGNPFTMRRAGNTANGNPATAYFRNNADYVIVDDISKEVLHFSNRNFVVGVDPARHWVPAYQIVDPYFYNPFISPHTFTW